MKNLITLALLLFFMWGCKTEEEKINLKTERIHRDFLTIDTHCDTPINLMKGDYSLGVKNEKGCVDFPRMKEGGLDAEFFAVFMSQGKRDDSTTNLAYLQSLEIFRTIKESVEKYSELASLATKADDAYRLKKDGVIAAYIGLENGYPIGKNIKRVKEYYDLGARYITLSHSYNNDICDSSTDPKGPEHNGLSQFGIEVVKEMNKIGMLVDVSHVSDKSFYDVLSTTNAPVIASHSSCRALCSSPRNFTDDMLLALKENGGVIQICILSSYIKTPEPNPLLDSKLKELLDKYGELKDLSDEMKVAFRNERTEINNKYRKLATVSDVVDHIDHVVQVIGIDYVGIGTDFDGGGGVDGCLNVSEMKNITKELIKRGYSRSDIEKIWGGNFMRVFRQVEESASSV